MYGRILSKLSYHNKDTVYTGLTLLTITLLNMLSSASTLISFSMINLHMTFFFHLCRGTI